MFTLVPCAAASAASAAIRLTDLTYLVKFAFSIFRVTQLHTARHHITVDSNFASPHHHGSNIFNIIHGAILTKIEYSFFTQFHKDKDKTIKRRLVF